MTLKESRRPARYKFIAPHDLVGDTTLHFLCIQCIFCYFRNNVLLWDTQIYRRMINIKICLTLDRQNIVHLSVCGPASGKTTKVRNLSLHCHIPKKCLTLWNKPTFLSYSSPLLHSGCLLAQLRWPRNNILISFMRANELI